jgi:hypothetical protein
MDPPALVPAGGDQLVAATATRLLDDVFDERGPEPTATRRFLDEDILREPE